MNSVNESQAISIINIMNHKTLQQMYTINAQDCLKKLSSIDIFGQDVENLFTHHVWERPLRLHTAHTIDFDQPVNNTTILDYKSLFANRVLSYLYERDLVFLPAEGCKIEPPQSHFNKFYNTEDNVALSLLQFHLEKYCLGFLPKEVNVVGQWTKKKFLEYYRERTQTTTYTSLEYLTQTPIRPLNAQVLLVQHGLDFLVEASHMTKIIGGDFGVLQSEIFKVLIDEFGYGVHKAKHSQLFKELLKSIAMSPETHYYWQFYLTSTLLLNNFFHYITTHKQHFFKYLGAICLAEQTFGPYCKRVAEVLQTVYADKIDVRYYLEHAHIDDHHGRMMLEDVVLRAIDLYGVTIIPEIVTGMEWSLYIQELCDADFLAQITWMEMQARYKSAGMRIKDKVMTDATITSQTFTETYKELSTTHVHDQDELCVINSGKMKFINGLGCYTHLNAGEATVIRRNRLHGAIIDSTICQYTVYSIGDYKKYGIDLDK
jgi:mannose-6-phosphate isomerase-like protein (cupin superfamily)